MSRPVRRTHRADLDLDEIWLHIAAEDAAAAERTIERIVAAEDRLADFPELGQTRPDIGHGIRHWPVPPYLILYRAEPQRILIVRIVHGARDLATLFTGPEDD